MTGCTKISPGCSHCYAERMAIRLRAMGQPNYARGFQPTIHEHVIDLPLRWRRPQNIFVNSMSDIFHQDAPIEFIQRIFRVIEKASWHRFQMLTKRSQRLVQAAHSLPWPRNLWMGVTVENSDFVHRIDHLRMVNAAVRFLSLEPLLGPMPELDLSGIDWVIVGGESGPGARPMEKDWVLDILNQCEQEKIPFFFKQWGGPNKKKAGRILDGKLYDGVPDPRTTKKRIPADHRHSCDGT